MGKLWTIAKREYVERVRTRWFLVATVFGPLLFGALMILPSLLSARSRASADVANVVILDATGVDLGKRVALVLNGGLFGDTALTRVQRVAPPQLAAAESAATRAVMRNEAKGYLVLDSSTVAGVAARYAGRNASSIADVEQITRAVRQNVLALRLERANVSPALASQLTKMRVDLQTERITSRGRGGSGTVSAVLGIGVALLLYMSIILYGQNVLRGVMEEKSTRVAEIVVSSVPANHLLAGKVLGVGAVGLTQQAVWIAAGVALAKLRGPILERLGVQAQNFPLPTVSLGVAVILLLFFVLGYVLYSSLFAAVGAMVNNDQDAQQAATPVMLLLVTSIIFVQPILFNPTSRLASVMSWLPFSAPIITPLRMIVVPISPLELTGSIAVLLASCVGAVWLAARIYHTGLLMYGKRPTLRELVRWLRPQMNADRG
jgi:ABC-2 type transport system permease protein